MTSGISATLLENANATTAPSALSQLSSNTTIDKQEFLTLFIAQLQNQDPLSPLQPEELTAQLAQFSSLEQLTGINTRLDDLNGASQQSTTASLFSLIGREVRYDGSTLAVAGGQASPVTYTIGEQASAVTATLRAADGRAVRTIELGALGPGAQTFQFDGLDDAGETLPDGSYTLDITTTPRDGGTAVPVALVTTARIDGVDVSTNPPTLLIGSERVGLDRIHEVRAPAGT